MSEPALQGALVQSVIGLVLVFALIGAAAWLLKRLAPRPGGQGALLRTVATLPAGPKEHVAVIELGETWLVVGVTSAQISLLASMPRRELPASDGVARQGFASVLARLGAERRAP